MQLKSLLAAFAAALASFGSHATATDWGVHDPLEPGGAFVTVNPVNDTYKFSLAASNLVTSSVYSLFGTISQATYGVYGVGLDGLVGTGDDVSFGAWAFNASPVVNAVTLGSGTYYYSVLGNINSPAAYAISSSVTPLPVPEPETYAMLLAGLGVLGFVARRRRNK